MIVVVLLLSAEALFLVNLQSSPQHDYFIPFHPHLHALNIFKHFVMRTFLSLRLYNPGGSIYIKFVKLEKSARCCSIILHQHGENVRLQEIYFRNFDRMKPCVHIRMTPMPMHPYYLCLRSMGTACWVSG